MRSQLVRFGFLGVVVTLLMGADGSCGGGKVSPAKALCENSGGTWDDSNCPLACWPPACGEATGQTCTKDCGEDPVCKCPADKPYWVDGQGCWSQAQCNQSCKGTPTSCSASSCSQDGCYYDQCYQSKSCTRQKYHYDTCYRYDTCYQSRQCYESRSCYDYYSGNYYECGSYYDCGYYYDCTTSYDCGYWYTETYDCSYYEDCGPCKGTAKACTKYTTPSTCASQAGCRWE